MVYINISAFTKKYLIDNYEMVQSPRFGGPAQANIYIWVGRERNRSVLQSDHSAARRELRIAERNDGEGAGADEGGDLWLVAIPAEGDARTLERSPGQDPPQGLRELDQCYPLTHPASWYLQVYHFD